MRFSRRLWRWPAGASGAAVPIALAALLALSGCAHAPRARDPEPRAPAPAAPRADATPGANEPDEPGLPEEPERRAAPLDPSEVITPEELATLPEPVPRRAGAMAGNEPEGRTDAPDGEPGDEPSWRDSAAPGGSEGVWRVQIYASETRSEAERVARAASERLRVEAAVEREGSYYKVRLGGFATEAEAQGLRERAIRAGFPGAFRTRARP